jgi:hypothetical protein
MALLACLLFMPLNASAAEQVGRVLAASGDVTAEREGTSMRGLGRQDAIYEGDRIRTGTRGRVQVRFEDGALIDLNPASAFEVEEYESEDEDQGGGGSAVMSFLQGAMRTITGAIGGGSDDTYRMNTTVATIGVRGTAYALEYCDDACVEEGGEPGLYGRVDDGEVEVDGPGGTGAFGEGQYFFVPDGGAPERIVAPPEGVLEGEGETGAGGDDDRIEDVSIKPLDTGEEDGIGLGGNDTDLLDPDFESGEEGRIGVTANTLFAGAYVGSSGFASYESPVGGDVRIDNDGRVIGAEFGNDFVEVGNLDTFESGSTQVFTQDNPLDVSWGSWTGVSGPLENDEIAGFSYTLTDPNNITTPDQLGSLEGSANFTDIGGPSAVDSGGGLWSVTFLSVGVDFDQGLIDFAQLTVDNGVDNIQLGDNSPDVAFNSDGSFAVSGLQEIEGFSYTGAIEGRFIGVQADGALVAFEVREIDGAQRIVGSQVLGQAVP